MWAGLSHDHGVVSRRTSALSQGGIWLSQGGMLPDMSPGSRRVIGMSNTGLRRV